MARPYHPPALGRFGRRELLKSGLGALLLAPFMRLRALEAQYEQPKRLVLVFTPDSHPREFWPAPAQAAPNFVLGGSLVDFAGLEQHMLFVRQLDHAWTFDNHHEAGVAQLFTGERFFDSATHYANGPSIDQILLQHTSIRGHTPVSDIHLCVADRGGGHKRHVCCYAGPGQPIQRVWNPQRAYADIFGGVTFGAAPADAAQKRRTLERTLQIHAAELRRMQAFLGQHERERLERHVEALRDLELQLRANASLPAVDGGSCAQTSPSATDPSDRDEAKIRASAKQQVDLIVNAFRCDRTRIAELGFGYSGSHHSGMLGLLEGTGSWHDSVAHLSLNDATREASVLLANGPRTVRDAFVQFDRLWASQVAYLARSLAETPEGDGSMLDNTVIYWGVESGTDHNHSPRDIPYVVIGGKNLGLALGQLLQLPSAQSANKLHTSILHAFGHSRATGIGIEPTSGPLPGVLR